MGLELRIVGAVVSDTLVEVEDVSLVAVDDTILGVLDVILEVTAACSADGVQPSLPSPSPLLMFLVPKTPPP